MEVRRFKFTHVQKIVLNFLGLFPCTGINCSSKPNIISCYINSSLFHITVYCTYTTTTMATGYQVVAYLNTLDQVHKIYTNTTTNCYTQVTVEVEERGLYLVSVLPIIEGRGITGSSVEHSELVMVDGMVTTTGKLLYNNNVDIVTFCE